MVALFKLPITACGYAFRLQALCLYCEVISGTNYKKRRAHA